MPISKPKPCSVFGTRPFHPLKILKPWSTNLLVLSSLRINFREKHKWEINNAKDYFGSNGRKFLK